MFAEVLIGDGVFLFSRKVGMEFLDGCKTDVDVVWVNAFKIINRGNVHAAVSDVDVRIEKIFDGIGIEEVVFGLFDDVRGIDEEQEISIVLFVQVKNQPCHDERFAASRRHVEQEMQGRDFAWIIVLIAMEKARKGFNLIAAQFVFGIEIQFHRIGDFFS